MSVTSCPLNGNGPLQYYFFIIFSGVRPNPIGTAATIDLLCHPQMIYDGDFGTISGVKIGRGNRSTRRKRAPVPLCPQQIPHVLTGARTRAAAVGSQRLRALAMARLICTATVAIRGGLKLKIFVSFFYNCGT
jgi:hypothetical protein